ncbi:MAG: protease family protein [Gaiellales bacterium]|nr:protease family protein [Gaiellales bacterium]
MSSGPQVTRISPWWLLPPALLIALNVASASSAPKRTNGIYDANLIALAAVSALILGGYALLAAWLSRGEPADVLALRRPREPPRRVALQVAASVVVIVVAALVLEPFLHADREQGITPTRTPHGDEWVALVLALVVLGLLTPLCEELLFRGLIFAALGRFAVPGSAVLFALAHGIPALIPPVLVAGLVLGELRRRTGSVWPGVATHATVNTGSILVSLLAAAVGG